VRRSHKPIATSHKEGLEAEGCRLKEKRPSGDDAMKTKKRFDCVAMKRAGAAEVYRVTKGMTLEQELRFWRKETAAIREEQAAARLRAQGRLIKKRK
jgi:hypothetical protein